MIGKKGQMKAIKDYLLAGNTITSMEAYDKFGCTKLPSRISDLRKSGLDIQTIMVEGKTRYGTPARYARYRLVK
jgi:hypothetical protein